MSKKVYSEGTPSLREWEGLWRHSTSEKEATLDECNEATESLWSHLDTKYRVGSGDWDDLFLRGDFLGDRSQVLEIVYPPAVHPILFEHLGQWIAGTNPQWRVIIPTFLGHREAFVVYPEGVRHSLGLRMPSEEACKETARQLLRLSQFAHAHERATEEGWKW